MIRNAIREPPISGIFATRAPVRPNPIGLTTVKLLKIEGNKIYIDRTDAFDNTPIIDIKPYLPNSDCILNTTLPDYFEPLSEKRIE
ncbi:MAG: TrmO family methyltransferase domain-containing protein, partial [Candidatus Heimdallarchaeota archaeon]